MINIDFHSLLFPTEFEKLCRDMIEIRESPITFTSFKPGKDDGIDFRATKGTEQIIGQCKLYNPNHYSTFIDSLKSEVRKCVKIKPNRYILCTNIKLNPRRATEILEIFQGFILHEEDIIDGEKLNKYLGQPQYGHLLKTYSKLLVPNLQLVESALENIINRKHFNKTASFLREIDKHHKLFHNTQILKHCINTLEKNKVLILTGNPGVGKTTTAKMIANFFLHQTVKNILFLSDKDFNDIEGLYQNNQIIVVDDFWGQNFSPALKDGSLLRNFDRIINDFKEGSGSYLVLTSREYIIKDVLNYSEYNTRRIFETDRIIVNLDDYNSEDKVRIFLNHLLFYNFEKSYFSHLKYSDTLETIINHKNYSPRHIEYFIKQNLHQEIDSYFFFKSFREYLDKPNEYWNNNFNKLSSTSKLILLILLISSDPIDIIDLETSFQAIQERARQSLDEKIDPLAFYNELRLLEDFYLFSDKKTLANTILIYFQSPGIKDYLLEYLRSDGKAWIKPLIENAPFFNQLNFVFNTKEHEISDLESDNPLFGQMIVLSEGLQNILKKKILRDFHSLSFCKIDEFSSNEFARNNSSEETKYWKLFLFNLLFDVSAESNIEVRSFLINEVKKDIDNYQKGEKIVNYRGMLEFPRIIEKIIPYVKLDAHYIINCYWESITFTIEFDTFYKFKELFPIEFTQFLSKNLLKIKKAVKECIIDDIDYFMQNEMDLSLDTHLEYMIPEVCRKYKIRITSKFIDEIEYVAEMKTFKHKNSTKWRGEKIKPSPKQKDRFKPKKFAAIVNEYIPYKPDDKFNPIQFLKTVDEGSKLMGLIRKELKTTNSYLKPFIENKELFLYLISFLIKEKVNDLSVFNHYTFLDSFFTLYCKNKNVEIEGLKKVFYELSENSFSHDFSITLKKIRSVWENNEMGHFDIEILSPIIVAESNWYEFSNNDLKIYFIAEYLNGIQLDEIFKNEVVEYSANFTEIELLLFLSYQNKNRLNDIVVIPELKRFFSSIDTTTTKTSVLSFLSFGGVSFDFLWNKGDKSLKVSSSSESEWFVEKIIKYLGIDFSFMDIDIYFVKDYYAEEYNQKYFLNKKSYNRLYKHIVKTIKPYTRRRHIVNGEKAEYLTIDLYNFASDDESYEILKESGMENYILSIIKAIQLNSETLIN